MVSVSDLDTLRIAGHALGAAVAFRCGHHNMLRRGCDVWYARINLGRYEGAVSVWECGHESVEARAMAGGAEPTSGRV